MKKILSVALSLLMILSVFSVIAFAADSCNHAGLLNGITEKEPTCVTTGVKKAWCGTCQKYVYLEIPTIDHNWVWTYRPGYEPTINSTGIMDGVCSGCGKTRYGVTAPKLECSVHSVVGWEKKAEWKVFTEPTCTSVGKKQAWCNGCNKNVVRDVPMKEHDAVVFPGYEETCEEYGKTDSVYCYSCRTYLISSEPIPAKGHNMALRHGMNDVEPTCTEKGKATLICLNDDCDYEEKIEVKMISHIDGDNDDFCDVCEARICKCICHKDNFISRFIRKLNTLLKKLLKTEDIPFRCCECMEPLEL